MLSKAFYSNKFALISQITFCSLKNNYLNFRVWLQLLVWSGRTRQANSTEVTAYGSWALQTVDSPNHSYSSQASPYWFFLTGEVRKNSLWIKYTKTFRLLNNY